MKTKTKCYSFAFDEETDTLLRKMAEELGMKMSTIVERSIKMFAEKKGMK